MSIKSNHLSLKVCGIIAVGVFVVLIILAKVFHHSSSSPISTNNAAPTVKRLNDNSTGDSANETLQTLIAQNNQLKATQEQQKSQQDKLQADLQNQLQTSENNSQQEISSLQTTLSTMTNKLNQLVNNDNKKSAPSEKNAQPKNSFVWIQDQSGINQSGTASSTQGNSDSDGASNGVNNDSSGLSSVKSVASQLLSPANNSASSFSHSGLSTSGDKPAPTPYMTIPENATLTDAIAMQPLIGRIPRNGVVTDPRSFKFVVEAKNIAANGVMIPANLKGAVGRAVCKGDLLASSVTCNVVSLTFVFPDGRISTTNVTGDNDSLGTISDQYGNPQIKGILVSNATLYLLGIAATSGVQAYGNALSSAQTLTQSSMGAGVPSSITQIVGNSNTYAAGQALGGAAQATQQWWQERVQSSYDFVYVPSFDPRNNKQLRLNIDITKEIDIDYDQSARKVSYGNAPLSQLVQKLD